MSKNNNYKVYVHINKSNGKRYYGITKQKVEKRWKNGTNYRHNKHFTNAIQKYGWNNFEHIVLFKGLTKEEAELLEQMYIALYDTTNREKGYNQSLGGNVGNHSEESRKKISESNKGKSKSEEHRKNISKSKKGKNNPMYGKRGEKNPNYGKHLSEEHRKKMSESHKGKKLSEETRKKISEKAKGRIITEETRKKMSEASKGRNGTKIYCVELDMYFNTVTEASKYIGRSGKTISQILTGRRKTCGGYHWIYAEEVNEENINKVMSEKYNTNGNGKQIYCVELDKYFNSIAEASKYIGCSSSSSVSNVLNGRTKTAKGYHFIYAEDVEIENSKVS